MVEATPTRLTPPHCSYDCQQSYVEFLALPLMLYALQAEQLFLVSVILTKHPTTPTSNMIKSHKNHRDNRPTSHPPTTHFQLKLKKTYQYVIYFWKQGRGQMSQPLQNW